MLRLIRRVVLLVIAAVALFAMMPPAARALPAAPAGVMPGVRGVVHAHTSRSDGTGTVDDVVRAAARAGLKFVIVTDHSDGTRAPDLPDYRQGVLYIDAAEISTRDGHLLALGLPKTPYPLAGEARDVVDDVHRLGGIAIAAHPGSGKPELRWTDWNAPIDGLEWLNADSEWRDERPWTFARALLTYPFRPPQSLALLLDRPDPILRRWDELLQQRRVFGLAAVDAHSRVGVRSFGEPYDTAGSLHFPSYTNSFREFSIVVNVQFTGNAADDARRLLEAIRSGAFYSTIDALAGPAAFAVNVDGGRIRVAVQAPADARITLFHDAASVADAQGDALEYAAPAGVYRVEVSLPGAPGTPPVPWIVSNAVYVGGGPDRSAPLSTAAQSGAERPGPRTFATLYDGGEPRGWTIEKSPASEAAIDTIRAMQGTQLLLRFAISGAPSDNPYAAFVVPATAGIATYDRLMFTARANRPMRVSVQLRASTAEGDRWQRSVYLDEVPRAIELPFAEFRSVSATSAAAPVLSKVDALLFVVDTVNTKAGSNGQIQIDDIKYGR